MGVRVRSFFLKREDATKNPKKNSEI